MQMIRFSAYLNRAKMPIFTVGNIVYKSGKSVVLRPLWGRLRHGFKGFRREGS